jgi:hypothetical protein
LGFAKLPRSAAGFGIVIAQTIELSRHRRAAFIKAPENFFTPFSGLY